MARVKYKRIRIDGSLVCAVCYDDPGCDGCKACNRELHRYGDDPYCDECGQPHPGYFGAIKDMLGGKS